MTSPSMVLPRIRVIEMVSPISKEPSPMRNNPLIKLDAEVCEAKPKATVKIPAAPKNTLSLKPASLRLAITKIRKIK